MPNVIDSQVWLEYFAGSKQADEFSFVIEDPSQLLVPSITISEVFRTLLEQVSHDMALKAVAHMQLGKVCDLDTELSLFGAKLSQEHNLNLTEGHLYASTLKFSATLWTFNSKYEDLPHVEFRRHKASALSSFRLYKG